MRQARLLALVLVAVCIAGLAGWLGGACAQARREAERRYAEDLELAAPALTHPAFKRLIPVDFPVRGFCLSGPVVTQADYDRLRAAMVRLFGEPRVEHVLADVWVETPVGPNIAPDRRLSP